MKSLVGFAAMVVACVSMFPQLQKVITTRSAKDVSYGTFSLLLAAAILWHVHAYNNRDLPLRISTGINIAATTLILALKYKYEGSKMP